MDCNMKYGYTYTHEELANIIHEIFNAVKKLDKKAKLGFDYLTDNCETINDITHPYGSLLYEPIHIVIGMKSVFNNQKNGYVRDDDFVKVIKANYHELSHVYFRTIIFLQSDVQEYVKDIAKVSICADYLDEYKKIGYFNLPEEICSESYALSKTEKLFNKMNVLFDWKKICVEQANEWNYAKYKIDNFDDLTQMYSKRKFVAIYDKRINGKAIEERCEKHKPSNELINLHKHNVLYSILNAENGKEEADILIDYIVNCEPKYFRGFQCIKNDYKFRGVRGISEFMASNILNVKTFNDLDDRDIDLIL